MANRGVTMQTIKRLPLYLNLLKSMPNTTSEHISATAIAEMLHINDVVVRKDLASVSTSGKPKTGYVRCQLIREISEFLGYDKANEAIIIGAGKLGKALLDYSGFKDYGLNIIAAFDVDESLVGETVGGKSIFPLSQLEDSCQRLNVKIGIITTPADCAQEICDKMVKNGIVAIWNFAPVHLEAPNYVIVQDENLATSFAVLSNRMKENIVKERIK